MKKYWKTLLVSLVIITTISAYYIHAKMSVSNLLSYKIETISGDEKEIENMTLGVDYHNGVNSELLQVSKNDSKSLKNYLFEGWLNPGEFSPFSKYIKEHRQYMRGKELNPNLYNEDEKRLIYTNVSVENESGFDMNFGPGSPSAFQIDILDKKTNKNSYFKIDTPKEVFNHSQIFVQDVNVKDGKIRVFAQVYNHNGGQELHLYTIDEVKKKIIDDSIIEKVVQEDGVMTSIKLYNNFTAFQEENYYLYGIVKEKVDDGYTPEIISNELFLYNTRTNQVKRLDNLSEWKEMSSVTIHESDILFSVPSKTGWELRRYNIEKEKWGKPLQLNFESTVNDGETPFYQIINDKLYEVSRVSDELTIFIRDLRTGELLYEGKIVGENSENLMRCFQIYINQ